MDSANTQGAGVFNPPTRDNQGLQRLRPLFDTGLDEVRSQSYERALFSLCSFIPLRIVTTIGAEGA
jgi:hypothetical protein